MSSRRPERIDPLGVGNLFQGRYRVVREIGTGGMGAVYEVTDERTAGPRALKIMHEALALRAPLRARFEQEVRVTSAVESEHLVRVYDAGVENDRPFMVMELLRGRDLHAILEERRTLPPREVLDLALQVGRALDRTHAAGVVHRDLKPENLFITTRDDGTACVKILDFGVAKVFTEVQLPTTRTVGTPLYMAPEQIRGDGDVGPRADIYALGHVVYTMLVGEPYWWELVKPGMALVGVMMRVLEGATESASARALRRTGTTLPAPFDAWFSRATALDPADRFQGASDALVDLARCLGEEPVPASAIARDAEPTIATAPPRVEAPPTWTTLATLPTEHGGLEIFARSLPRPNAPASAPFVPPAVPPVALPVEPAPLSRPPGGRVVPSVAPSAPSPPATGPEPTPRWAWVLMGGVGFALVFMAVVAMALRKSPRRDDASSERHESTDGSLGPSSEKTPESACPATACAPLAFDALDAVSPNDALARAIKLATSIEKDAELTSMSAPDIWVGGVLDLRGKAPPLSFTFTSSRATITVSLADNMMLARRAQRVRADALPPNDCGFDQAWRVALGAGFSQRTRASLYYRRDESGHALLNVFQERHLLYIDPSSCEVVREFR